MISFTKEMLCEVVTDVDELLNLHYDELGPSPDLIQLKPMWEEYAALERMGRLLVLAVRDNGVLVGYAAFFVYQHLHYAEWTLAVNDVLFLHPEYRKGRNGLKMVRFCEDQCKAAGANEIIFRTKSGTVMRELITTVGYAEKEMAHGKLL